MLHMRNHHVCLKMISSQCWLISGVEIWGGRKHTFPNLGGRGPLGPPGSSAYVLSIICGIILPTIVLAATPEPSDTDVQREFIKAAIRGNVIVITLSLVSLYTPLVTIILLKPVCEAMKELVVKCCRLKW